MDNINIEEFRSNRFLVDILNVPNYVVLSVSFDETDWGINYITIKFLETKEFSAEKYFLRKRQYSTKFTLTINYQLKNGSIGRSDVFTVDKITKIKKTGLDYKESEPITTNVTFLVKEHDITTNEESDNK